MDYDKMVKQRDLVHQLEVMSLLEISKELNTSLQSVQNSYLRGMNKLRRNPEAQALFKKLKARTLDK